MSVMHVTATAGPGSRAAKPQQILDAARALFLRDGFSATSMDAVAKAAGVSKATVYAHYKSKEELFAAMIGAECGRTWPELAARYQGEAEPIAKIRDVAQRYVRFILSDYPVSLLRTVAAEAARSPALARIFYEAAPGLGRQRFAELLVIANAQGVLRIADPLQAADTFFSMLRGDLHLRRLIGLPAPEEQALAAHAEEMTGLFLRMYAP
jgi:TetR/AcrR family transcriptional regulator, mexJK operon transcriptional repressor